MARDDGTAVAVAGPENAASAERRRLAEALAESQAWYQAVVGRLEEGVTLHDAQGRVTMGNPSAARILGVPEAELPGLSLVGPEWRCVDTTGAPLPPDQHPVSLALATGEPPPVALVGISDRAGEFHWLQMKVVPIVPGVAARLLCLFADITFARREEEARQRTEVNFRTLIERTPDAIAVYQSDTICYANPRMVSLLGYTRIDDVLGRPAADIVHPDDRALLDRHRHSVDVGGLARGQPALPPPNPPVDFGVEPRILRPPGLPAPEMPATEERFLRGDGAPVPVEVTIIPIFFDGEPATLVHARDLTERKRLEAHVVMADRLSSVGRLAAAVGHEINNPLAYVMANIDLALERLAEPDVSAPDRLSDIIEMLRESREGADRVRHIVRDLKVFSRGETEEKTRVDPRRVLDSCVNMARGEIRQCARLVKRYVETPPVLANEAHLGQVLLNLLINAVHAIPAGAAQDNEIEVGVRSDERGRVVIRVRDTGVGISDDVRRRIFEPFFTTKAGGLGTGLGLSICLSIVTALGGELEVESQVGVGTTFFVILPPAPPPGAPGAPGRAAPSGRPPGTPLRDR